MFTDNSNITHQTTLKTSRTQRWFLLLWEFEFTLNYINGCKNAATDYFSRKWKEEREKGTSLLYIEDFNNNNIERNDKRNLRSTKGIIG